MTFTEEQYKELHRLIGQALDEDLRYGPDITTQATVDPNHVSQAHLVSRAHGIVAGLDISLLVLEHLLTPGSYQVEHHCHDGASIAPQTRIATITAPTQGLLTAERTMLNLLCHLSGIATTTAAWVKAVEGTNAKIRDTRKTLPGLRLIQKYAVHVGGGVNHRMGLGDAALIKDNHIAAAGSIRAALQAVREADPNIACEVEVDSLEQLDELLTDPPALILLDNFPVWQTQIAVQRRNHYAPEVRLESSGGLTLDSAYDYAATGVDYLAMGSLTHSVQALDIGLDM